MSRRETVIEIEMGGRLFVHHPCCRWHRGVGSRSSDRCEIERKRKFPDDPH